MKTRIPAQVRPPGYFLKAKLEKLGWTQNDLAEIIGRSPRLVSEIISAKRGITPETAKAIGAALGTGPEVWMNFESQYQLSKASPADSAISLRADVFGKYPIREMQKRGWLPHNLTLPQLAEHLAAYVNLPAHAAKKTGNDKTTIQQAVWLARAQQLAPDVAVATYTPDKLEAACLQLRQCVREVQDAARVPEILASAGIKLLIIEPLPGSKIDAACMWHGTTPLIVMTLRYDKHDIFWHALFHELDHVRHGEGKDVAIVETDMMSRCSAGAAIERRANAVAAATLISPPELDRFRKLMQRAYSEVTVLTFAARMQVHPGIVVGQLQHLEDLPWSAFSRLKSKIRSTLVQTAFTDGFPSLDRQIDLGDFHD
jgi:HTH-type transcriptional regulator/antitoxin HigA